MYNLNFQKLVNNLLPAILRKKRMKGWLECLVTPIKELHDKFLLFRAEMLLEASVTPQVASLEFIVNKVVFGSGQSTACRIVDGVKSTRVRLYNRREGHKVYVYNRRENKPSVYVYNRRESMGVDFIVYIPSLTLLQKRVIITKLINKYKVAGTTFRIDTYEP